MTTLSTVDQIAQHLVTTLAAADFTGRWKRIHPKRFHYPQLSVDELADVAVCVYPQSMEEERQNRRGDTLDTYAVSVSCSLLLASPLDNENSDWVRHLAGEIRTKIKDDIDSLGMQWLRTEWTLFIPEELAKKNIYTSVVTGYWQ